MGSVAVVVVMLTVAAAAADDDDAQHEYKEDASAMAALEGSRAKRWRQQV
jgi:hypothetical protein